MLCLILVQQLLVVVSPNWDAMEGILYRYQRISPTSQWQLIGVPIPITLGQQGMAWGNGEQGLNKKEGDCRSPAGIFPLGPVFGDSLHQSYAKAMPFILITDDLECVDDPNSEYYNQFVNADSIGKCDWKSSEKMKEVGFLYDLGVVVQYNINPAKAGAGSAIFIHIWRGKGIGTAGCTAMEEENLNEIVPWLNIEKNPCLVQLPFQEYNSKMEEWGLPTLK